MLNKAYEKKILLAILLLTTITIAILLLRGSEDSWICENGRWIKHGNPSKAMPIKPCGKPVACTAEAKLCSDGSYVSRIAPDCNFAPCPKQDLISVENLSAGQSITSPLTIKGQARGSWFFEASFPIKLLDQSGSLLASVPAQAKGNWMTNDFVPFEAELKFSSPTTSKGSIILEKDNPSGLTQNADQLIIPVSFAEKMRKIFLYYYDPAADLDETENLKCSADGLVAVQREIPISKTPIQDTIKLLLLGKLTKQEQDQGITTEYPLEGVSLKQASLNNGILTLLFDDPMYKTTGGSCRVNVLWLQIEATAKQFTEVKEARFEPYDIFQL
ncbi:MAG: Gmad2 immunoglobulin-like domain-containing protein [bacterium]